MRSPLPALPTRLRPADLLRITDQGAEDVLAGRHDALLPADLRWPADHRWAARLHSDDEFDVWLISWVPHRATELHDHAGSIGALTVLSGDLSEYRWTGAGLNHRRLSAGDQAAFPLGWVHDVVRAPAQVGDSDGPADINAELTAHPTLSVHAYSPPLTAVSYYEVTPHSTLRRTHTVLTDQHEGPLL